MVIARVDGSDYLTNVEAPSAYSAEHYIIDKGICGLHDYGVENCMAYDAEAMKTDTFIFFAMDAEPITYAKLVSKILQRNEVIQMRDEAEKRTKEIKKQIKELNEELQIQMNVLNA